MTLSPAVPHHGIVPVAPRAGLLEPLGLDEVRITGGFWASLRARNHDNTIPHIRRWLERAGWVGNFEAAAAQDDHPRPHHGRMFADSEIYKLLEAMAWDLSTTPDPEREQQFHALVGIVAAAQEPDGYLNTYHGRAGRPRYSDLEWGHELYCYGHLLQAATARLRTGHDDLLVRVGRAVADHVCETFGPDGIRSVCGHPEIEMALVEFGRATGERRYIDQAALFVDRRGHQVLGDIEFGREYYQDDIPIREAESLRGHAVRALYLAAGAADVAIEHDDAGLFDAVVRQWRHAVARRTYLTGGMGSQHQDEAFGEDFALPADRAYAETCAGVASVMLSWRLLLATGRSEYADLAERTLYNVVAASPALDGRAFFYTNTLHQRVPGSVPDADAMLPRASSSLRAPWFEVSCCPPNVARTLASLPGYLATRTSDGVQLHQYADCEIDTWLADGRRVQLRVDTDYPGGGSVTITSTGPEIGTWTLSLRVPPWAEGATVTDPEGTRPAAPGTIALGRTFGPGDTVRLELPVSPRISFPDPRVDAVRGTVAVERGPLVLCVESVDLPGHLSLADLRLDPTRLPVDIVAPAGPTAQPWVLAGGASAAAIENDWPYRPAAVPADRHDVAIPMLPYHLWANRGPSTMRVWIPVDGVPAGTD